MQRSKSIMQAKFSAPPAAREVALHPKLQTDGAMNMREELWWSRRLASGSDWMQEWIHKPNRR